MPTRKQREAFMRRAKERREVLQMIHQDPYIWAKIFIHLRQMREQGPNALLKLSLINRATRKAVMELLPDRVWWYWPNRHLKYSQHYHKYTIRERIHYLRYLHHQGPMKTLSRKIIRLHGPRLRGWKRAKNKGELPQLTWHEEGARSKRCFMERQRLVNRYRKPKAKQDQ